jgi:hypothetical protein
VLLRRSPSGPSRIADGLFGVRRHDRRLFGVGGHRPAQPLPRRPSGRQGDKRARAILRDRSRCIGRSGGLQALPGLVAQDCGRPPFLGRAPAAPRKRFGQLGSSSEHPVRFVIGTRDGLPSGEPDARPRISAAVFGRCGRVPSGPIESVFGQVRMGPAAPRPSGRGSVLQVVLLRQSGRSRAVLRSALWRMLRLRVLRGRNDNRFGARCI